MTRVEASSSYLFLLLVLNDSAGIFPTFSGIFRGGLSSDRRWGVIAMESVQERVKRGKVDPKSTASYQKEGKDLNCEARNGRQSGSE